MRRDEEDPGDEIDRLRQRVAELEATRTLLEQAREIAELGSYVWDLRDDSLTWSANMYRIAGLDEDTFDGTLTDVSQAIIHPDDQERIATDVRGMVESRQTWPMEFRIVRPDGEERLLQSQSRFLLGEDGVPIVCVGVHHDITERERTKAAQARSDLRFLHVVQNIPDPVFAHRMDGGFAIINRAACESLGYTYDELIEMSVDDVDPDALGRRDVDRWSQLASGVPITFEARHRRKDGSSFPVELRLTKLELENEPIVFAVARDISDRKRAEDALRRSRYQLEVANRIATCFLTEDDDAAFADALDVVLEALQSPLGYVGYIDSDGSLVCPSMTRGAWRECEVAGKTIVFPRSRWTGLWGRSLLERRSMIANWGLHPPEGHLELTCALVVPVLDGDELLGQLAVANREGGYAAVEQELLEAAADRVAPILKARNRRIAAEALQAELEERLRQAQKLEAVGLLAGGVAHDFNNILQAIYGHAEFALLTEPGGRLREHLQQICSSAERAAALVRQLLAFGRKQVLQTRSVDLNEVLERVADSMQEHVGDSVWITRRLDPGLPAVEADRGQIEEALTQLLRNASEAMPEGGAMTLMTARVRPGVDFCWKHGLADDVCFVQISVRDTGVGMCPETLEHIFEPFFTTKEVGHRQGLGLATVYGIVRQHGGAVVADSSPGEGTELSVYLPVGAPTDPNAAVGRNQSNAPMAPVSRPRSG